MCHSYGVVLWEMLTRNVPHKGVPDEKIIADALKGQIKLDIPESCPDAIKNILKSTSVCSFTFIFIRHYEWNYTF